MRPRPFTVRCASFSLVALLVFFFPALAAFRPSFSLDFCSWNATHIVLAEITPRDDEFHVRESWKGNLHPGDLIRLPQLKPGARAIPISFHSKPSKPYTEADRETIPKQPAGSRVILFLRKESEPAQTPATPTENSPWQAADILFHEFKSSAIWLEGPQLYIFTQPVNPGPSLLSPWHKSLADAHARVQEVLQVQQSLAQASLVEDNRERAERLKPYARCEMFPARELALQQLAQCGPAALPTNSVHA